MTTFNAGSIFASFRLDTAAINAGVRRVQTSVNGLGKTFRSSFDAGRRAARRFNNALKRTGSSISNVIKRFTSFRVVLASIAGVLGASRLTQLAADAENAELAFSNLTASIGEDASSALAKLRAALRGTVSDLDILRQANNALVLGVGDSIDQIAALAEGARRLGAATGRTPTEAFEDIIVGIGRQSRLILDNLGIIVSIEDANREYAEALGIVGRALDDAESKQAFFNATVAAVENAVERLGPDILTFGQVIGQFSASLQNFFTRVAQNVTPALRDLFEALIDLETLDLSSALGVAISIGIEGVANFIRQNGQRIINFFRELSEVVGVVVAVLQRVGSATVERFVNLVNSSPREIGQAIGRILTDVATRGLQVAIILGKAVLGGLLEALTNPAVRASITDFFIGAGEGIAEGLLRVFGVIQRGFLTLFAELTKLIQKIPGLGNLPNVFDALIEGAKLTEQTISNINFALRDLAEKQRQLFEEQASLGGEALQKNREEIAKINAQTDQLLRNRRVLQSQLAALAAGPLGVDLVSTDDLQTQAAEDAKALVDSFLRSLTTINFDDVSETAAEALSRFGEEARNLGAVFEREVGPSVDDLRNRVNEFASASVEDLAAVQASVDGFRNAINRLEAGLKAERLQGLNQLAGLGQIEDQIDPQAIRTPFALAVEAVQRLNGWILTLSGSLSEVSDAEFKRLRQSVLDVAQAASIASEELEKALDFGPQTLETQFVSDAIRQISFDADRLFQILNGNFVGLEGEADRLADSLVTNLQSALQSVASVDLQSLPTELINTALGQQINALRAILEAQTAEGANAEELAGLRERLAEVELKRAEIQERIRLESEVAAQNTANLEKLRAQASAQALENLNLEKLARGEINEEIEAQVGGLRRAVQLNTDAGRALQKQFEEGKISAAEFELAVSNIQITGDAQQLIDEIERGISKARGLRSLLDTPGTVPFARASLDQAVAERANQLKQARQEEASAGLTAAQQVDAQLASFTKLVGQAKLGNQQATDLIDNYREQGEELKKLIAGAEERNRAEAAQQEARDVVNTLGQNLTFGIIDAFRRGGDVLQVVADSFAASLEDQLSKLVENISNQIGDAIAPLFGDTGLGGTLGGLAGLGLAVGAAALARDGQTGSRVTEIPVEEIATSQTAVRGVVAGPANVAIAEVGAGIREANRGVESLLRDILEELRVANGAAFGAGGVGAAGVP